MPVDPTMVVDTNSIPSAAIQRVEIISGGASAVYGADAVGGVVNFILKDDFEGASVDVRFGDTEHGGNQETSISGLLGVNAADDRGNVMFGIERSTRGRSSGSGNATGASRTSRIRAHRAARSSGAARPGCTTRSNFSTPVPSANYQTCPIQTAAANSPPSGPAGTIVTPLGTATCADCIFNAAPVGHASRATSTPSTIRLERRRHGFHGHGFRGRTAPRWPPAATASTARCTTRECRAPAATSTATSRVCPCSSGAERPHQGEHLYAGRRRRSSGSRRSRTATSTSRIPSGSRGRPWSRARRRSRASARRPPTSTSGRQRSVRQSALSRQQHALYPGASTDRSIYDIPDSLIDVNGNGHSRSRNRPDERRLHARRPIRRRLRRAAPRRQCPGSTACPVARTRKPGRPHPRSTTCS